MSLINVKKCISVTGLTVMLGLSCLTGCGINDEVILTGSEMRIYRNGKIENMGAFLRRELELPSHRLDDTLLD